MTVLSLNKQEQGDAVMGLVFNRYISDLNLFNAAYKAGVPCSLAAPTPPASTSAQRPRGGFIVITRRLILRCPFLYWLPSSGDGCASKCLIEDAHLICFHYTSVHSCLLNKWWCSMTCQSLPLRSGTFFFLSFLTLQFLRVSFQFLSSYRRKSSADLLALHSLWLLALLEQ